MPQKYNKEEDQVLNNDLFLAFQSEYYKNSQTYP